MSGLVVVYVPLGLLLACIVAGRRRTRLVASGGHPLLGRADAVSIRARGVGVILGVAVAPVAWRCGRLGQGVFVAPLLVAVVLIACLAVAEAATWSAARSVGSASLEQRRPLSYLPGSLVVALVAAAACLGALLSWCRRHQNTTVGDFGYVGRAWVHTSSDGQTSAGGSPFPGTFYSVPMVWTAVTMVVVLAVGLAVVGLRPRNGADAVVVAVDDDRRRGTAAAMVAAGTAGICGELLLSLLASAQAAGTFVTHGAAVLIALSLVPLLVGAWAGAVYLEPGTPRQVGA